MALTQQIRPVKGNEPAPQGTLPARHLHAATSARQPVAPPVARSRFRIRHWLLLASFLLLVVIPVAVTAWYLETRAVDQYASNVGFSVRREDQSSAISLLGGITDLAGAGGASDADILYEYLQGQQLVAAMDDEIGLRDIWSGPFGKWRDSDADPFFGFDPDGSIEDLVDYWNRMVRVSYDGGTGLIELRVLAFQPDDARRLAQALLDRSSALINELNEIAEEDAVRSAREDVAIAVERLKKARQDVTTFRNVHRIVDPEMDLQSQAGLLGELQGQLVEAMIDADLLRDTARPEDPRLKQAERKITTIERRMDEERGKLGMGTAQGDNGVMADLIGQYEALLVDREFAEASYTAALANYDAAQAEARRKSRYLAAYLRPTLAETARFPERGLLLLYVALFAGLSWAILVLVGYAVKDRR